MKKYLTLMLLALLLTGCHSSKLAYFDDLQNSTEGQINLQRAQIKIQPDDELMINVTSEIPEATAVYNLPFNMPGMRSELLLNTTQSQKQTYVVGNDGDITFPVLGRIHVAGMTTEELASYLTKRISEDVENPYVRVELVNFKINVMGEVLQPGSYVFETERVTVLDALAKAGDMTVFGRRDNVTVWREEDGVATYHRLDLNDSKTVASPYYYLKQNDVVYVEPGSARSGQAEFNQNNNYKISVVSAVVSGISVIASLIIALVK